MASRDASRAGANRPADRSGRPRGRAPEHAIESLPSALDRLDEIVDAIGDREVALFLDFDGTLAPIVARPEDATLPPATRRVLGRLAARRPVAVVSGRDLDDLRARVALPSVHYAGSHGLHVAAPDGSSREHPEAARFRPSLDRAEALLTARLASHEGVQVERKRDALAVHVRRAPRAGVAAVRRLVDEVGGAVPGLALHEGREVYELRPDLAWNKGRALGWILEAMGRLPRATCPIVLGDDRTDEDAFRAVGSCGLAIVVRGRSGPSAAAYALADPDEVRCFLQSLDERLTAA